MIGRSSFDAVDFNKGTEVLFLKSTFVSLGNDDKLPASLPVLEIDLLRGEKSILRRIYVNF